MALRFMLLCAVLLAAVLSVPAAGAEVSALKQLTGSGGLADYAGELPDVAGQAYKPAVVNTGVVFDRMYRGGKLDNDAAFRFLKDTWQVNTVINMRYPQTEDQALCAKYSVKCVDAPVQITPKVFDYQAFLYAFKITAQEYDAGRRVYIHCAMGSDRTGALAAAMLLRKETCGGQTVDRRLLWAKIEEDLARYGFHQIFGSLKARIKNWTLSPEQNRWLCE